MFASTLNALILAALTEVSPEQATAPTSAAEASDSSDLMGALRASDVAEIFIVRRGLTTGFRMRPDMVRVFGCRYRLHRGSRAWRELERGLADADIRIAATAASGEVRVGLVLSDRSGTVREIYSNDLAPRNGAMTGFDQRQQVEISASFVRVLATFVANHPDLALASALPVPVCARDQPT